MTQGGLKKRIANTVVNLDNILDLDRGRRISKGDRSREKGIQELRKEPNVGGV